MVETKAWSKSKVESEGLHQTLGYKVHDPSLSLLSNNIFIDLYIRG
jgi:hypothetical protein